MNPTRCALAAAIACTGCASFVNDPVHPMKVETRTQAGANVTDADCRLTNDAGTYTLKSGDTVLVRRSTKDLHIVCSHPANPDATARAISRASAGMWGNVIFGGGIGAVIDHSKGTAYSYPTWVQLVFGKTLVFDSNDQKEGLPTPSTEAVAAK
jgi:hypothetical protein